MRRPNVISKLDPTLLEVVAQERREAIEAVRRAMATKECQWLACTIHWVSPSTTTDKLLH